jgi:ABC-2 type transport system permease protein
MTSTSTIVDLPWWKRISITSVFARSLADRIGLTVWIGVGLGLLGFMVTGMFDSLVESLHEMDLGTVMEVFLAGSAINTPEGWLSAEMYTMMVPMGLVALAVMDVARSYAGEEENRSIGMLGGNPLSRTRVIVEKAGGAIGHVVIAGVIVAVAVAAGNSVFGLGMASGNVWAASTHAILLGVMFAAVTTLIAALTGRRLSTMLITAAIAGVAYLVATFFPLIDSVSDWARLSPWHYYYETNPLATGADWGNIGVMAAIAAVTYVVAWYVYSRRDLPG